MTVFFLIKPLISLTKLLICLITKIKVSCKKCSYLTPFVFDVFKVKSVFFYVRFDGNGTIGGSRPSDKRGAGHPDPGIWRKGSLSGGGGGGVAAPPGPPPGTPPGNQ